MRPQALAIAGYYPTPEHLTPVIAGLFERPRGGHIIAVDPCAGEGKAVLDFLECLCEDSGSKEGAILYACEMEATRHEGLNRAFYHRGNSSLSKGVIALGDAFNMTWERYSNAKDVGGASVLWLNPPYDSVGGRLEEKFLARFLSTLAYGGYLVYILPFYALKDSAETLGRHFEAIECFRFPEGDWEAYKQVVLIGRRHPEFFEADLSVKERVLRWASSPEGLPVLGEESRSYLLRTYSTNYEGGFAKWEIQPLDLQGILSKVRPWMQSDRSGTYSPIPGIIPEVPLTELMTRNYPMAMPPRPAHIAAGIAAGVFNGARIEPNDPKSRLPDLLVKGSFDREFRTIDEKTNKDGETVGLIQVQQPKLVTTVLDLSNSTYHTITPSTEETNVSAVKDMTMADLLARYGRGMMRVMLQHCPVLHDPSRPGDNFPLPTLPRRLYSAQETAARASIRLLGGLDCAPKYRKGKAAFVLGEIGSGKTTVAMMVAEAIKSKRVLVMCPPHLLQGWADQIATVLPWVKVVVLTDVTDVQKLASDTSDKTIIAILSRETAKLGHALASVKGTCPKCGNRLADVDFAKKRETCDYQKLIAKTPLGKEMLKLASFLLPLFPTRQDVAQFARTRFAAKRAAIYNKRAKENPGYLNEVWANTDDAPLRAIAVRLSELLKNGIKEAQVPLMHLLAGLDDTELTSNLAREFYDLSLVEYSDYGASDELRKVAVEMTFLLPINSEAQQSLVQELRDKREFTTYYSPWQGHANRITNLTDKHEKDYWAGDFGNKDGILTYKEIPIDGFAHFPEALRALYPVSEIKWSQKCGERLYQSVPEPRRYPLATYIAKRHPKLFDLLVLDEGHEYATDGSAQERSAHRLTALGLPTLNMTGTIMNGFAESLFTNMWALSPKFREEFARDESARFVDRYGYRKRLVEQKNEDNKVVTYGSVTDRVETSERFIGNAPGVLPLFLLRHLLGMAVTIHKADLAVDIPKCNEIRVEIEPSAKQRSEYERLQTALMTQIRKDRFEKDLSGKLFGALSELPSFLDRCTNDVGNVELNIFEVAYPESIGGGLVAASDGLPADVILPKEEWMLAKVKEELSAGRNVMVFAWHVNLLPRLAKLIEAHTGEKCPILNPNKVATGKRQDWIDREIVKKKRRVMVVNPVAIQTGLNNLVYFATEIWMQNPAVNPVIYRQAVGRVDRIGQVKETQIFFPVYANTPQTDLYELLMHKVAVSMQTDGLDNESMLVAAGIGSNELAGLTVGRYLWKILSANELLLTG